MTSGIVSMQAGADAGSSADYQRTLDSRLKYLELAKNEILEFNSFEPLTFKPIVEHNLGYLPAFTARVISLEGASAGSRPLFVGDTKNIYMATGAAGWKPKVRIGVYNVDFTSEYRAPITRTSPNNSGKASDVGLAILKQPSNVNIEHNEFSNFSVHTDTKAMNIQQHGTAISVSTGVNRMTITHDLGYPPSFMLARIYNQGDIFIEIPSDKATTPIGDFYGVTRATSIDVTISGGQSAIVGTFGYIILKDPLEGTA